VHQSIIAAGLVVAVVMTGTTPVTAQASDRNSTKNDKNPSTQGSQKSSGKNAAATPFDGQVVKVSSAAGGGKVWVKHANGQLDAFRVNGSTKITGVASLGALTKGSMVSVVAAKGTAHSLTVSSLAPPLPPDKVSGTTVTGAVVKAHSDKYGDSGTLTVKTPKGEVRTFQVTNATIVEHPKHADFVHSFQFVVAGDTVRVEHDGGKVALLVAVTATK
jgi:hypothetical protein